MKFAVIRFPGSNCDQDCYHALADDMGVATDYVWHKEESLEGYDAIVIPGGFSYGDYLRCGAIARFSPVMAAVQAAAAAGKLVLGVCNGFQILCESGLLPGALIRNRLLRFVCAPVTVRVESGASPFTAGMGKGTLLSLPVAHGEGCYFADDETLADLARHDQVLLRYVDPRSGLPSAEGNPNGSREDIAGICNRERNVFGLMPHPDRACHPRLGSTDGQRIFSAMRRSLAPRVPEFGSGGL
jgi:phosphoribosylformylglycinamidine synthase I